MRNVNNNCTIANISNNHHHHQDITGNNTSSNKLLTNYFEHNNIGLNNFKKEDVREMSVANSNSTSGKIVICNICGVKVSHGNAARHKRIKHLDPAKYDKQCNYCMKKFPIEEYLRKHLSRCTLNTSRSIETNQLQTTPEDESNQSILLENLQNNANAFTLHNTTGNDMAFPAYRIDQAQSFDASRLLSKVIVHNAVAPNSITSIGAIQQHKFKCTACPTLPSYPTPIGLVNHLLNFHIEPSYNRGTVVDFRAQHTGGDAI